jgi:hypothetical protein
METGREFSGEDISEGLPISFVLYVSKGKGDQVAMYLGLRQKEWLFLICHNSWIVFRLVNVNGDKVLAYSPVLEMANSSVPFRACLGALLSVMENAPVRQTVFAVDSVLETLNEDPDEDDSVSDRRIWITCLLGAGSTGGVYEGSLGGGSVCCQDRGDSRQPRRYHQAAATSA